jgi:DNA-binding protein HU-beta
MYPPYFLWDILSLISKGYSCILSNNFNSKRRVNTMAAQKKVLTKGQTVTHFAEKFEIFKKVATSMLEEYAALAIAETKKKGAFVLPGIGKSVLVKRKARIGRNPQTGKEIKIPAKTVVRIRPAKTFKEAIVPPK